ncbi:nuclear transport factor 2 family protein [Variovorax atrisoli]|uniref:nuclear transport factor 2 family protein n=1 Tax=Variovorax atrisoli TaxID=3394203 RepID=UPI001610AB13|nr:nuclear transport factor 2 family protein [Variovorax sp. BK613]MBB3642313.1 ketosteroid isomerase-like protein [Variovorax sp. BK613]
MSAADEELHALEARRRDAMLAGDVLALGELLAPELRYVHSTGTVDSRDSLLHKLAAGAIAYRELELAPLTVTPCGDALIVAGEMRAQVLRGGGELRQVFSSYLAVWRRQDRRWQLAACQGTALPAG